MITQSGWNAAIETTTEELAWADGAGTPGLPQVRWDDVRQPSWPVAGTPAWG